MTYRELLKSLMELPDERLDDDATVFDTIIDEFYPVITTKIVGDDQGVLDAGHLVITIEP